MRMKKNQQPSDPHKDTPATRKRRLQKRLDELSNKSEQELAALMRSVEKVKKTLHSDKSKLE